MRSFTFTNKKGKSVTVQGDNWFQASVEAGALLKAYPSSLACCNHCRRCDKKCGRYQFCSDACMMKVYRDPNAT